MTALVTRLRAHAETLGFWERWDLHEPFATVMQEAAEVLEQHVGSLDRVYRERNAIACALAVAVLAGGGRAGVTTDPVGEDGFRVVVVVRLPTGRVGWHMDESDPDRPWAALPPFAEPWETFTSAENTARLMRFARGGDGP
jgi:hypothetical protein